MADYQDQEMFSVGMLFLAFLMALAALNGIWFLAVILKMLAKMIA